MCFTFLLVYQLVMSECGFMPTDSSKKSVCRVIEPRCDSLLTVLDDKNRAIENLQKQLENQKIQLAYYLKKELSSSKIVKLSHSCIPQALEEAGMPVNLAVNKFYKQIGMKSKIMDLHERMTFIDHKISSILKDQANVLREIINSLYNLAQKDKADIERYADLVENTSNIELFNKLLQATNELKKQLDTFRICCNRLIIIEDERTEIVEQVYSLPSEQRLNCNYLIGIQMEKIQLEAAMKQILKDQSVLKNRIKELSSIERKLSNLQNQFCSSEGGNGTPINDLLEEVNSDANILLKLTKHQRDKQLSKRQFDESLTPESVLRMIRFATNDQKALNEETVTNGVLAKQRFNLYENIKLELTNFKGKIKKYYEEKIKRKMDECEFLRKQLNELGQEKSEIVRLLERMKKERNEAKSDHSLELQRVSRERDLFKTQVEDLQAIRAAYAQLVNRQPDITALEGRYIRELAERDSRITELETEAQNLKEEVKCLNDKISSQKSQIFCLLKVVEELNEKPSEVLPKELEEDKQICNERDSGYAGIGEDKDKLPTNITEMSEEIIGSCDFKNEDRKNLEETRCNAICPDRRSNELQNIQLRAKQSIEKTFLEIDDTRVRKEVVNTVLFDNPKTSSYNNSAAPNVINVDESSEKSNHDRTSLACFEIYCTGKDGKKDVMKAVIKSNSNIEGKISVEKSSFSLNFNCSPNKTSLQEVVEDQEIDEFELMKDCSQETIPVPCPPRQKIDKQKLPVNDGIKEFYRSKVRSISTSSIKEQVHMQKRTYSGIHRLHKK